METVAKSSKTTLDLPVKKAPHWTQRVKQEVATLKEQNANLKHKVRVLKGRFKQVKRLSGGYGDGDDGGDDDDSESSDPDPDRPSCPPYPDDYTIFVRFLPEEYDNKLIRITVHNYSFVDDIKSIIWGMEGIPINRIHLMKGDYTDFESVSFLVLEVLNYGDTILMDFKSNATLPSSGDEDEQVEVLFNVSVREQFGERNMHHLTVNKFLNCRVFSFFLQGKLGFRQREMKLTFDDHVFSSGYTLDDFGVDEGSVIELSFRLGGGANPNKKRKPTLTDMRAKDGDHQLVLDCFAIQGFQERGWLNSLPLDQLQTYIKSVESGRFAVQVSATVENIREFKILKATLDQLRFLAQPFQSHGSTVSVPRFNRFSLTVQPFQFHSLTQKHPYSAGVSNRFGHTVQPFQSHGSTVSVPLFNRFSPTVQPF